MPIHVGCLFSYGHLLSNVVVTPRRVCASGVKRLVLSVVVVVVVVIKKIV